MTISLSCLIFRGRAECCGGSVAFGVLETHRQGCRYLHLPRLAGQENKCLARSYRCGSQAFVGTPPQEDGITITPFACGGPFAGAVEDRLTRKSNTSWSPHVWLPSHQQLKFDTSKTQKHRFVLISSSMVVIYSCVYACPRASQGSLRSQLRMNLEWDQWSRAGSVCRTIDGWKSCISCSSVSNANIR